MNITLSKSEDKSAFYRILFFLGILVFLFLIKNLVVPWVISTIDEYAQYASMSDRLELLSDWKTREIELKQQINQLKARLDKSDVALIKATQTSAALQALDSLAEMNNVTIKELKFASINSKGSYNELLTELNVDGRYRDIAKFLKRIETKDILLNVNSLNIKINSLYSRTVSGKLVVKLLFRQ